MAFLSSGSAAARNCLYCGEQFRPVRVKHVYCRLLCQQRARYGRRHQDQRPGHLKRRYGITQEQYDALLRSQGGKCGICKCLPGRKRLCVDHDHATGRIRGLLCVRCNSAVEWYVGYGWIIRGWVG